MKQFFLCAVVATVFIACNNDPKEEVKSDATTSSASADSKKANFEVIGDSLAEPIKKSLAAFERGDAVAMTDMYTDDAVYSFSGGDTLVGRQSIQKYYESRTKLIESIKFSHHIFLPVNAKESPNGGETPGGKWVLSWQQVNVKYKNGKALQFWVHNAHHFNDAGKVDGAAQYIDKLPISLATK